MDDKSLVYNIELCRICQFPSNFDLINTSCFADEGDETYSDILKFIFMDILWIQDDLISIACTICLKKIREIAEFKRLCLKTNTLRQKLNESFQTNIEISPIKVEIREVQYNDNINLPKVDVQVQLAGVDKTKVVNSTTTKRKRSVERGQLKILTTRKTVKRKTLIKNTRVENDSKLKELDKSKLYRCDICGEEFNFMCLLERHVYRHNGSRNYICTVCGRKYITQGDLSEHLKLHSGEYNYPCDLCSKKFKSSSNLKTHKNVVHADPKDYKYLCTDCGKKFSGMSGFKEHVNRHKQIRSFPCSICDKSFVSKSDLQSHVLSHSNNRQFKCDLCSAEYKRKYYLLVHKSEHHNIGNYKRPKIVKKFYDCTFCGKSVAFKDKFERHLRTHTGFKPYQCRRCDAKFACKSYIKPHLKKKHDIYIDMQSDIDTTEYYTVLENLQENNDDAVI